MTDWNATLKNYLDELCGCNNKMFSSNKVNFGMINNNVLVTFTTQNSPIFTSQHLIPYKRAINFLYQPKV